MELHGTQLTSPSKEIRCSDCGHVFRATGWQKSSRCGSCGNIVLHGDVETSEPPASVHEPEGLGRFRSAPDGHRVQEILSTYQVEWQLWAMTVKNFSDPAFHAAYLTHTINQGTFELAAGRYQEHRSVMAVSDDYRWQAEIADLMLERVQSVAAVRMQQEGKGFRPPAWLLLLPWHGRTFRLAWVLLGLVAFWRLFGLP